jgi:hypothetical protein
MACVDIVGNILRSGSYHCKIAIFTTINDLLIVRRSTSLDARMMQVLDYQFQVREAAVKTGGFQFNFSGSSEWLPFILSFAFCFAL